MTTFTHFTDPYRAANDPNGRFAPPASPAVTQIPVAANAGSLDDSYYGWNGALDGFDAADLDLLLRSIELVVQAGTFSPDRLQLALRVSPQLVARMTASMEKLGVIAPGEPTGVRRVLVNVLGLEVLLAKLMPGRQFVAVAVPAAS